ncbi:MAG: hypothetical protein Q9219_004322 [cf. Caloplaca sp. 3 TL-2023]
MSIQGGSGPRGGPKNGVTYCAPISTNCSKLLRPDVDSNGKRVKAIASEQDWQAKAHGILGRVVGTSKTDIWLYHLRTVSLHQTRIATFVEYYPKKGGPLTTTTVIGGKREIATSSAAVFGVSTSGEDLHLDIPDGYTAEMTLQLHEQILLANGTITQKPISIEDFDMFELHQAFRTASRLSNSTAGTTSVLPINLARESRSNKKSASLTPAIISNFSSLEIGTLNGPTHQDPRREPPIPILQIGLDYTQQDNSYIYSNDSHSRVSGDQPPKKSCGPGSCSFYGWCGTTNFHCNYSDPLQQMAPCQDGFGGCEIAKTPSCGQGSSGTRQIAYYQSWNVRQRKCQRISPHQIQTSGLTHLYFAFAGIHPTTFTIEPLHPADPDLYVEFTSLRSVKLQTWIAIGGFDFSNPGLATHTTWSDMVSSQANRAAFIKSLINFMKTYGFQGVDLDWEYPAAEVRGGKADDTKNLVTLVKEIRAAFGTQYGLSVILAPDYWYLRGMDPKGMEPYVDWFGFMAYDLHGFWDADVKTIGAFVRAQTDLRDISNDTLPLWFDALNPAKLNLGLAYYGRGYTLTDRSCNYIGCPFKGPSKPAPCTNYEGVMSHREIKQLIQDKNLKPTLDEKAQIKQLTWDDQWIGYDDHETLAAKARLADSLCMRGTMIWSVDFDSGPGSGDVPDNFISSNDSGTTAGGGNNPGSGSGGNSGGQTFDTGNATGLVYVEPSVWTESQPLVACVPPCVLVLPPLQLGSTTVITFPPLTTTYVVDTVSDAGHSGSYTLLTITTTVPIPPVTTTEINIWAVTIFADDITATTFSPVQSVMPPPVTATFPEPPWELPDTDQISTNGPSSEETILYPHPTFSVTLPPLPALTYTRAPPKATCTSHCGDHSYEDDDKIDDEEEEEEDEDELETCILGILGEGLDSSDIPTDQVDSSTIHSPVSESPTPTITPAPTEVTIFTTYTSTFTPVINPDYVECYQEDEILFFQTWLTKMTGPWIADGGKKLRSEVSGCGSMTGWHWTKDKNDGQGAAVTFRTQPLMKFGCVERAIRSAGGPKVACYGS